MVRAPMQVDPEFHERMKKIKKEIMIKKGEYKGFPKIQREIIKMPEWDMIEKKLTGDIQEIEFRINLDRRRRR